MLLYRLAIFYASLECTIYSFHRSINGRTGKLLCLILLCVNCFTDRLYVASYTCLRLAVVDSLDDVCPSMEGTSHNFSGRINCPTVSMAVRFMSTMCTLVFHHCANTAQILPLQ